MQQENYQLHKYVMLTQKACNWKSGIR